MADKPSYAMLEITSRCSNRCPLCLPPNFKGQHEMSLERFQGVAAQLGLTGTKKVTLAGFGNPVEHPKYLGVIDILKRQGFEITVTARASDVYRVGPVARVNVSVDSVEDAASLIGNLGFNPPVFAVVPHIVLTNTVALEIQAILSALWKFKGHWERITIATPVVLCDDPGHRETIRESVSSGPKNWQRVDDWLEANGRPAQVSTFRGGRASSCSWLRDGVYIDSRLNVLSCCYRPVSKPFGNLERENLLGIWNKPEYRDFRLSPPACCQKCPDLGD